MASIFNSAGGDEQPLNESQKRSLNTFFKSMADTAHQKHETLKQNTVGAYQLRNGYDPTKSRRPEGVMNNFDQQYDSKMKGFADLPTTSTAPEDRPAPTGTLDKLAAFLTGGGGKKAAPAPQAGAPAQPPMSFEDFKKRKAAGQL